MIAMTARPNDNNSSYFQYPGGENKTSTAFLIELQGRNYEAWKNFMDFYVPLILHWCDKKESLKRPDRQDILQEVLVKVSKSIDQFDLSRPGRSFRAWLRRITENQICDHFRKQAKRPVVDRLHSDPNHPDHPIQGPDIWDLDASDSDEEARDQHVLLKQIIKRIKSEFREKSWKVYHLSFIVGKDSAEVAKEMGMKNDAVRKIRSRILRRLREEAEKLELETELPNGVTPEH